VDGPEADADDIKLGARSPEEVDRTERGLGNLSKDCYMFDGRGWLSGAHNMWILPRPVLKGGTCRCLAI
jgi:hypothetical protein